MKKLLLQKKEKQRRAELLIILDIPMGICLRSELSSPYRFSGYCY